MIIEVNCTYATQIHDTSGVDDFVSSLVRNQTKFSLHSNAGKLRLVVYPQSQHLSLSSYLEVIGALSNYFVIDIAYAGESSVILTLKDRL